MAPPSDDAIIAKESTKLLTERELSSTDGRSRSECTVTNPERPFYVLPSRKNRHAPPRSKALAVVALSLATAFGYQIGSYLNQPRSSPNTSAQPSTAIALIPVEGGEFTMGDTIDLIKDAPPHQVIVTPFSIGKTEVTLETWDSITRWGRDHGYTDLPFGNGKQFNHPVYGVSWADAVKWCNALSEKEGLVPCYYADAARHLVARSGVVDIGNQHVNWDASGYRLPTEAEWEFAARGGLSGRRFPSGDTISHDHANYHGAIDLDYDKAGRKGTLPALTSSMPYTAAVASFPPNDFGLHDMTGNVAEWCWDFYAPMHDSPTAKTTDPRGPDSGLSCVVRGGSWRHTAADARCASRFHLPGDAPASHVGIRVVRRE